MIDALVAARSEDDPFTAARALDRVLPSGFDFVLLYHPTELWTAYSTKLQCPRAPRHPMHPLGMILEICWLKEQ